MAFTETAARNVHAATATTVADSVELTDMVNQVTVTNREASAGETIYVTVATGNSTTTSAQMEARLTTAVANADETFAVLPQQTVTVFKSPRRTKVALSIVGNASDYSVHGTPWFD